MTVCSENRLLEVNITCCNVWLIVAETALFTDKLSYMRILVIFIFKRFTAKRTEMSLRGFKSLSVANL